MSATHATTSRSSDDPLLQSALSELESEGVNLSEPVQADAQDESMGDAGEDSSLERPDATPNPAETGAAESETTVDPAAPSDAPPQAQDDPLAGSEPFTYTVDGQPKTMEGVYRVPGEGLIVPEEQVPKWQLMASRADSLERTTREQYQRLQDYEKLSAWTTKDPNTGTESTLTGRAALEAREVQYAKTLAVAHVLSSILEDPKVYLSLAAFDGNGNVVLDEQAVSHLLTRAQLAGMTAEQHTRSRFQTVAQDVQQTLRQAEQQEQLPGQMWSMAEQHWVKDFPTLTAQDKTFLANQVPRYLRPATDAEVQAGQFQRGETVLDPAFYEVIKDRADLRASTVTTVKAATSAQKFNAGQQHGRQGTTKPAPRPAAPQTTQKPASTPKRSASAAWDDVLQSGLAEIG